MIADFLTWLTVNGKSKNTVYNYKLSIQNYFTWYNQTFDSVPTKLYIQNVKEYLQFLRTTKSITAQTINARISALHSFNEYLIEAGMQESNVVHKNLKMKVQNQFTSPAQFEGKEINKFLQAILKEENHRNYALVILLANTGLRISEALNICINTDLFFESKELIIREGKGDKQRTVLLNEKVISALRDYFIEREDSKYKDSPYLFVSNKGEQLNRITVNNIFTKYSKIAGMVNTITPHDLRHYFCSYALESGFDVHEVAYIAGHSNIQTTLLYTNPSRQKMLDKLNRM